MRQRLRTLWPILVVLQLAFLAHGQEAVEEALSIAGGQSGATPRVMLTRLENDPIVDATERYLAERLETAEAQGIPFMLLLDTPGGAVDTTRSIVRRFLGSKVPVFVLVGPPGGRAGSAGVFITLSAHVAGMTPGTNIGAAHPIGAGVGAPAQEEEDGKKGSRSENEVMAEKIENDLVAFAEAIAKARGRNVEWAIDAVRNSASVPADRALELGVVDLISDDVDDFLNDIDGMTITIDGKEIVLRTAGAKIIEEERTLREKIQIALGNPSVAYTLMSLGVLGIVLELYNPGMLFGAIFGGICLVLGLASGLPFSAAGLLLLAAAGILFVLEVYVTSFGLLSIAGGVCMVLGGIFLFEAPPDMPAGAEWDLAVGTTTLATVGVMAVGFGLMMAFLIAKAHLRKPVGGEDGLVGEEGRAIGAFADGKGRVFLHGEYWNAVSKLPVADKETVRVMKVMGLKVQVEPIVDSPRAVVEETEIEA